MKLSARVLFSALFALLFVLVVRQPVQAQEFDKYLPTYNQYAVPETNSDVPKNLHTYTQSLTIEVMSSLVCQIAGVDPIRPDHKCLGIDPKTGKIGFVESGDGAIGLTSNLIAMTFTPPASSTQYVRYLAGNFGIAKDTHAVTTVGELSGGTNCTGDPGLCGLAPLQNVWVTMRNVVYIFFVAIFVIIGVAIMLRVHIDPRTVMTVENQIPRIIIGILLVTFSFAIAGFMIDLMYVVIYLGGSILMATGLVDNYAHIATAPDPFTASGASFQWLDFVNAGASTVHHIAEVVLVGEPPASGDILGALLDGGGTIISIIVGIFAWLVIFVALLFTLIRLLIVLLVAYISVILDVIFSPFWILIGLLPDSQIGAGAWFKDLGANLAVFPAAIIMLALAGMFLRINPTESGLFKPPLVGGGLPTEVFGYLIALGFLFMTPQVLTMVKQAIKAPKVSFGPALSPVTSGASAVIGTGRGIGASIVSSKEQIIDPTTKQWTNRGVGRATLGRWFR